VVVLSCLGLVAVLVVALLVNAHLVRDRTEPARADVGRILHLRGGSIQVRVDGAPSAPAIVLIHRFASSIEEWDAVEPMLARTHRVIRIDLLGHGGSAKPARGYSIENQARLVNEALNRLSVSRAVVVGHSMGGAVAVALTSDYPAAVSRLVVMDTNDRTRFFHLPRLSRWAPTALLGPALWTVVSDSMIRNGLAVMFAPGYPVPEAAVRELRRMTYSSYTESLREFEDYLDARGLDERLASLHVPRLVIWGGRDRLVSPAALRLYRRLAGVRIAVLARSGHSPLLEEPRRTAAILLRFASE
jgi:pimeloyl-ACP methyl ester carboxylesterase